MHLDKNFRGLKAHFAVRKPADLCSLIWVARWAELNDKEKRDLPKHQTGEARELLMAGLGWLTCTPPSEAGARFGIRTRGNPGAKKQGNMDGLRKAYTEALNAGPVPRLNFKRRMHNNVTPEYAEALRKSIGIGVTAFAEAVAVVNVNFYKDWIENNRRPKKYDEMVKRLGATGAHAAMMGDLPRSVWEAICERGERRKRSSVSWRAREKEQEQELKQEPKQETKKEPVTEWQMGPAVPVPPPPAPPAHSAWNAAFHMAMGAAAAGLLLVCGYVVANT